MDEKERRNRLKKVQGQLEWLWSRIDSLESSTMTNDRKSVAKWREKQKVLEEEEGRLLAAGREALTDKE